MRLTPNIPAAHAVYRYRKDVSVTDFLPLPPGPNEPHVIVPIEGVGDMFRAIYDQNNNNIVDSVDGVELDKVDGLRTIIDDLYDQIEDGIVPGYTIPPHNFSWGDASQVIFKAPTDGFLTIIRLQMKVPFNGSGASMNIGTHAFPGVALPDEFINLHSSFEFENSPDLAMLEGDEIVMTLNPGSANVGSGAIFISFLPVS